MNRSFRWASVVALSAVLAPAHARASACQVPVPILFSYPSAEAPRVPSNAVPFVIPDGFAEVTAFYLDNRHSFLVRGVTDNQLLRFEPGPLLTPGKHEISVEVSFDSSTNGPPDWDDLVIAFEVDPVQQLAADVTSAARILRVVQLIAGGPYDSLAFAGYRQEKQRLEREFAECSAFMGDQTVNQCDIGGRPEPLRDYLVEFEAEGEPLGFFVNNLFLPGHCRSAFFPEPVAPWSIRTVTATGLGSSQTFAGEVEQRVPAALELPPYVSGKDPPSWWDSATACSAAPPISTRSPGCCVFWALLASVALARRARR